MAAAARSAASLPGSTSETVKAAVVAAAEAYLAADVAANVALGEYGADAVLASLSAAAQNSDSSSLPSVAILTHCNAGALATAGHGTALGVVRSLAARGRLARAFCTETRPYNQGARLTAFELASEGFPATLLCDSAAAALLVHGGECSGAKQEEEGGGEGEKRDEEGALFAGRPHAVVVGADRVAANGDTANKVGTLALAVAAKRGGVPFFVAAPTTTLDALLPSGEGIPIEQRPTAEVTHSRGGAGERVAAKGVRVWNPSFDVTPADLITGGIITEKGMVPRRRKKKGINGGEEEETELFDVAAFVAEHATGPAAEAARKKIAEEEKNNPPPLPSSSPSPSSSFEQLDCASVARYVAARPALAALVGDPSRISEWDVKEVGDGNINFVFVVRGEEASGGEPRKAIVIKQALPFIRIAPDWPLSVDRARIEAAALREHGRLLALEEEVEEGEDKKKQNALIPRVHLYDPERALIAMDFVAPPAAVARGLIVAGKIVPGLAEDVAEYAAVTLFGTSLLACCSDNDPKNKNDTAAWRAASAGFSNPALCALTERVVFEDPYRAADTNRHTSPQLDAAAAFLRDADAEGAAWARRLMLRFSGTREALLHGDLHTGSVMGVGVEAGSGSGDGGGSGNNGENANGAPSSSSSSNKSRPRAVVIDPEFAFYGPIGFDLGEFTANLLMAFLATDGRKNEKEEEIEIQRAWLAASVPAFWDRFELRFRALWRRKALAAAANTPNLARLEREQDVFLASVRDDAVRFAGCCVLRRVVGIAHVEDFESIADAELRALCEARALRLGREMMVGGSAAFPSFGALVEAAEMQRGKSRDEGWVGGRGGVEKSK